MDKLKEQWLDFFQSKRSDNDWWERKKALNKERNAEIIAINCRAQVFRRMRYDNQIMHQYLLYLSFLMKQQDYFYLEEHVIPYQFQMKNDSIIEHIQIVRQPQNVEHQHISPLKNKSDTQAYRFSYDRLAAVKYAEHWWNSYNPAYEKFDVDCTNFISQCLHAGGTPMVGAPNRNRGWWHQNNNWSYSWSVAHSLRWHLSGSTQGLQGQEAEKASDLSPGDVICYDFQGDGRWDHTTIVVAKDLNGMPLVNAHTDNSRHRYWSYEDSTAWTPNIKYKFFRIGM